MTIGPLLAEERCDDGWVSNTQPTNHPHEKTAIHNHIHYYLLS